MLQEEKKQRVAVYIRVSTIEQDEDGYGEDLQMTSIKNYISSRDRSLMLAGEEYIYKDLGISGGDTIEERPEMNRMFDDLKYSREKLFDVVIVYKIDRFARKLSVLLDIVDEFRNEGIGFISTQESIDTSSAFGNAMLGILGVFAELERDMIKERTHSGRIEAIKAGVWVKDKYGYDRHPDKKTLSINKSEAKIVLDIFEQFVYKGRSVAEIKRDLDARKILIPGVSKNIGGNVKKPYFWNTETIRDILKDEAYIGKYYYNKSGYIESKPTGGRKTRRRAEFPKEKWLLSPVGHAPIIDEILFNRAQELLHNGISKSNNSNEEYLLTGLLKCDDCKKYARSEMRHFAGTGDARGGAYRCSGRRTDKNDKDKLCHVIPLNKDNIEQLVLYYINQIFNDPSIITKYVDKMGGEQFRKERLQSQIDVVHEKICKIECSLSNAKDAFLSGEIYKNEYNELRKDKQELKNKYELEYRDLYKKFNEYADIKRYKKGFEMLSILIGDKKEEIFNNKSMLHHLLTSVIDEIVVYSRDKREGEALPGRKKKGGKQRIPYKIDIKFRLPQEFLNEYVRGHIDTYTAKELQLELLLQSLDDVTDLITNDKLSGVKQKKKQKMNNLSMPCEKVVLKGDSFYCENNNLPIKNIMLNCIIFLF